ncbi:hypothetical protein XELAEV_18034824mg [Xenopus laevis]|uniref:Beta-microseminoprotein n=1 Tax=Xenopus laevis TaxID=8355 RepID=A0A974CF68_XENLA|nr:hypothetical protein XELAEV_18034824mg [Xenopus laevis]
MALRVSPHEEIRGDFVACRLIASSSERQSHRTASNIVLASVIAFGLLVTACNAFCFTELPKMGQTEGTTMAKYTSGCLYKDKLHRLGSKFRTNDCMDCTCHMDGKMACCQAEIDQRNVRFWLWWAEITVSFGYSFVNGIHILRCKDKSA